MISEYREDVDLEQGKEFQGFVLIFPEYLFVRPFQQWNGQHAARKGDIGQILLVFSWLITSRLSLRFYE